MIKKQQPGFTLLEVLIALSIITIGALGVFALMNRTVLATEQNRNSIIAVNLAREGIELVRSIRDSAGLGFAELDNNCGTYPDCNWIIDSSINYNLTTAADSATISSCTNCMLYITGGQYSHDNTGQRTGIKRLININNGGNVTCVDFPCEKVITVQVLQPGATTPYTLITHLTDWR